MEINVEETIVLRIQRQPPNTDHDRLHTENVEYFKHLGVVTVCTREIEFRIVMTKAIFKEEEEKEDDDDDDDDNNNNNNNNLFTSELDLNVRKKLVKFCVWSVALYGTEI